MKLWLMVLISILCGTLVLSGVRAELVAVSQLGYHPESVKQVISYTNASNGTAQIRTAQGAVITTIPLVRARTATGASTNCQGNLPCIVGDFSELNREGSYYITTNLGGTSPKFDISSQIYQNTSSLFLEFFQATVQQNSSYHADFHKQLSPQFTYMADGSFIFQADMASLTLIRLGSAYRTNPALFTVDRYTVLRSDTPDLQEYIVGYTRYLQGLQGLSVQERSDGVGFRLNRAPSVINAFIPGKTNITKLTVYTSSNTFYKNLSVISLCGSLSGTNYTRCINDAAAFYKCQVDEPCLNLSYTDKTGVVLGNSNGYGVSKGWGYDFGCFFDSNLTAGNYNAQYNPCMVFHPESNREYTSMTLLAYLEAYPAVKDYSNSEGNALLARSIATAEFIAKNYSSFTSGSRDSGYYGASLFLLYDYTGNTTYLHRAHALREIVSTQLISDQTRGEEFYWEEYIRHKPAILQTNLTYTYQNQDPVQIFRGKLYYDYKDAGPSAMDKTGERVFQFDPNIQFQNSRYMLTEAVIARKTIDLQQSDEGFMSMIADNQLSWLTGMNAVQNGTSQTSGLVSRSFIFGVGNFPSQYHSRYLMNTRYTIQSGGKVVGSKGTIYKFKDSTGKFVTLDGSTRILGQQLGSLGNGWRNESITSIFQTQTFTNGKTYIPGWINGAYDSTSDTDTIFNYLDSRGSFTYTETTNEIVATALELMAYSDAAHTNATRHTKYLVIRGNQTGTTNNTLPSPMNTTNLSITLAPMQWYPQGLHMIWECIPSVSGPYRYDYYFGDGAKQLNTDRSSVYYIYPANGTYHATCRVTNTSGYLLGTANHTLQLGTLAINQTNNQTTNNTSPPQSINTTVSIAPWFPQGRNYIFLCNSTVGEPRFDWNFGDGDRQFDSLNRDVYHTYSSAGSYTVSCRAFNSTRSVSGQLLISVV